MSFLDKPFNILHLTSNQNKTFCLPPEKMPNAVTTFSTDTDGFLCMVCLHKMRYDLCRSTNVEKFHHQFLYGMVLSLSWEQGVPEKYVRLVKDTYEDARTQVKTSIGLTGKITVRVGLLQGSSLSPLPV